MTPLITGLNAAHGLLFMPSTPGGSDISNLLQSISQQIYQAFASLGASGGQAGTPGPSSIPTTASIASLIGQAGAAAMMGVVPNANS